MEKTKQKRKPRESNYINITDPLVKDKIKDMVELPNKDLHLNYVLWYRKDDTTDWGLTIKGFPDKKFGTQHVFKVTWYNGLDNDSASLVPAPHCANQTKSISGDGFTEILNIYNKYKK
jgi:hypothetical protein